MAEGGVLWWKRQKIDESRGPPASFRNLHQPLLSPPNGYVWHQNPQTREWVVIPVEPVAVQVSTEPMATAVATDSVRNQNRYGNGQAETIVTAHVLAVDGVAVNGNTTQLLPSTNNSNDKEEDDNNNNNIVKKEKKIPRYVQHAVIPTDTFQGICLRYKIAPTELRRANRFSGSNLLLAPSVLRVPVGEGFVEPPPQEQTRDGQVFVMQAKVYGLSRKEARAYLELADWDMEEAVKEARADLEYEKTNGSLRGGR